MSKREPTDKNLDEERLDNQGGSTESPQVLYDPADLTANPSNLEIHDILVNLLNDFFKFDQPDSKFSGLCFGFSITLIEAGLRNQDEQFKNRLYYVVQRYLLNKEAFINEISYPDKIEDETTKKRAEDIAAWFTELQAYQKNNFKLSGIGRYNQSQFEEKRKILHPDEPEFYSFNLGAFHKKNKNILDMLRKIKSNMPKNKEHFFMLSNNKHATVLKITSDEKSDKKVFISNINKLRCNEDNTWMMLTEGNVGLLVFQALPSSGRLDQVNNLSEWLTILKLLMNLTRGFLFIDKIIGLFSEQLRKHGNALIADAGLMFSIQYLSTAQPNSELESALTNLRDQELKDDDDLPDTDKLKMMFALTYDDTEQQIEKLIDENSNKPESIRYSVSSMLTRAIYCGNIRWVKVILEKNKSIINQAIKNDMSPLLLAAKEGQLDIVKYLISLSANIFFVSKIGESAYKIALDNNDAEMAEYFEDVVFGNDSNANKNQQLDMLKTSFQHHLKTLVADEKDDKTIAYLSKIVNLAERGEVSLEPIFSNVVVETFKDKPFILIEWLRISGHSTNPLGKYIKDVSTSPLISTNQHSVFNKNETRTIETVSLLFD